MMDKNSKVLDCGRSPQMSSEPIGRITMSEMGVTALAVSAGAQVRTKLRHPRRAVDEQGRDIQFPQWGGYIVWVIVMGALGIFVLVLGVSLLTSGEDGAIFLFPCGLVCLLLAYSIYRIPGVWYYEDDNGFEILSRFLHKKISMPYSDISSWKIEQGQELIVKTQGGLKASVPLPLVRPLKLLNALVTMEAEGHFGKYDIQRRRALIENEFYRQVTMVLEEMKETGAHIDIPERYNPQ